MNMSIYDEFWNTFKGVQAYSFHHAETGIKGKYILKNTSSTTKIYLHILGAPMRKATIKGIGFNRAIEGTNNLLREMKVNPQDNFENTFIEGLKELIETNEYEQIDFKDLLIGKGFTVIQVI